MNSNEPQPSTACRRPCHNCPFRRDIIPYQSTEDVRRNLACLLNRNIVGVCHHSSTRLTGRKIEKACAGFLLLCRKLGIANCWLRNHPDELPKSQIPVFESLDDFFRNAVCALQTAEGRFFAYLLNQPKGKREALESQLLSIAK